MDFFHKPGSHDYTWSHQHMEDHHHQSEHIFAAADGNTFGDLKFLEEIIWK